VTRSARSAVPVPWQRSHIDPKARFWSVDGSTRVLFRGGGPYQAGTWHERPERRVVQKRPLQMLVCRTVETAADEDENFADY